MCQHYYYRSRSSSCVRSEWLLQLRPSNFIVAQNILRYLIFFRCHGSSFHVFYLSSFSPLTIDRSWESTGFSCRRLLPGNAIISSSLFPFSFFFSLFCIYESHLFYRLLLPISTVDNIDRALFSLPFLSLARLATFPAQAQARHV